LLLVRRATFDHEFAVVGQNVEQLDKVFEAVAREQTLVVLVGAQPVAAHFECGEGGQVAAVQPRAHQRRVGVTPTVRTAALRLFLSFQTVLGTHRTTILT